MYVTVYVMNTITIPITKAREDIFNISDKVAAGSLYTLTEHGRPKVVMISVLEFESWLETMEVALDFPNLKKDIAETKRDIKSGKIKDYTTLKEIESLHKLS